MTYLSGVALFIIAGYSIIALTKISEQNLIYDIALGWFIGAGYYSLAWFVLVYALGADVTRSYSFAIIFTPLLIMIVKSRASIKENIALSIDGMKSLSYLPASENKVLNYAVIAYCIIVITIVIVHGVSTPSNADDALRLRAYTPILAYDNSAGETANSLIFQNGPWPTFTTILFWHILGDVDHFYVNYTIATSFFFFITLLYVSPLIQGEPRRGLYSVFLVLSLPLFVYHGTITYADARLAYVFALGFMFFSRYARNSDSKDLKITILFFTLACFIKDKGEILGITGLAVTGIFALYDSYRNKNTINFNTAYFLLPFGIYFLVKSFNSDFISRYFTLISGAAGKLMETMLLAPEQIIDESVRYGLGHGLLSSGNFGIIFYILIFNIIFNIKHLFHKNLVWEFLLLAVIAFEIYYFIEYKFDSPEFLSVIVNRAAIILAVISALFLSSLWSHIRMEGKKE